MKRTLALFLCLFLLNACTSQTPSQGGPSQPDVSSHEESQPDVSAPPASKPETPSPSGTASVTESSGPEAPSVPGPEASGSSGEPVTSSLPQSSQSQGGESGTVAPPVGTGGSIPESSDDSPRDLPVSEHTEAEEEQPVSDFRDLEGVELSLGQTSFPGTGEAVITAYVSNVSDEPVTAAKQRIYRLEDGENPMPEDFESVRTQIPAASTVQVLSVPVTLEPGEYAVELQCFNAEGGRAVLSANFSVEPGEAIQNPASPARVEMTFRLNGRTGSGRTAFEQTFVNHSSQTLLAGWDFRVERRDGGFWLPAGAPKTEPAETPSGMIYLRPGQSFTFSGALPFSAREMPEQYRVIRTLTVEYPQPGQEASLTIIYTASK